MDRDSVADFVGSVKTARKGLACFEESRIVSLKTLPDLLEGSVLGSSTAPYKVRVKLDRLGNPAEATCGCPRFADGWSCEHIAAVLYAARARARGTENPILEAAEKKEHVTEMAFVKAAREKERGTSVVQEIQTFLHAPEAAKTGEKKGKTCRLVFVLEWFSAHPHASGSRGFDGGSWVVAPKGQYVKANGSPGETFDYGRQKICVEPSSAERILLSRLVSKEGSRDELVNHLDLVLSRSPLSLFMRNGMGLRPLAFERISQATLRFVPGPAREGGFLLRPVLDAVGDEGGSLAGLCTRREIVVYGLTVLLMGGGGTCLYREPDEALGGVLSRLFSEGRFLGFEDASDLKEFCASRIPALFVEPPPDSIKVRHLVPRPIFEVEKGRGGAQLALRFSYRGSEVPYGEGGDLLPLEDGSFAARDRVFEKKVFSYISNRFRSAFSRHSGFATFQAASPPADFLAAFGRQIIEEGFEVRLKGERRRVSGRRGKVGITLGSGVDWLDLRVEYVWSDGRKATVEIDPEHLAAGLLRTGDSYTIVTREEVETLGRLVKEGMSGHGTLRLSRYRFALVDDLYDRITNTGDPHVLTLGKIVERLRDFGAIEAQQPPRSFHGVLRDYQQAGLNWLFFLRDYGLSGCLADDMGLGKTVQALVFLQALKERGELGPALIVVPVNTILNWEAEIKKFTPSLGYALHYGPSRVSRAKNGELQGRDVIVTSYHTLRNDIDFFRNTRYGVLIFDESHQLKNPGSLLWRACRLLDAEVRLAMTGTPLENNSFELWAQMEVLNPGLLGGRREFQERFAKPIEVDRSEEAASELRKLIFPFILRRKKEEVVKELPPKSEIVLYSEMEEKQAALYAALREKCREAVLGRLERDGLEKSALDIFSALLKLRQAALFPGLVDARYRGVKSCKFEQLTQLVGEIRQEGHKVLVFSQFVKALTVIREHFEREGTPFSYIDGSTSAVRRGREVRSFEKKDGVGLFLLSLRAGGTGINLTSADYVILYDPWWNPAVESQAIDRAHRIGQTRKVIAYKLIVKDTVEEKILELQERKKKLVREIVTADAAFFKSLTKEDILNLF